VEGHDSQVLFPSETSCSCFHASVATAGSEANSRRPPNFFLSFVIKVCMIKLPKVEPPAKKNLATSMANFSATRGAGKRQGRVKRPPPPELSSVARETVQDRVYLELRKALIHGLFDPGQVLTIQDLAASLSTSTLPVRAALSRLISEQALEALPNRSVRVPPIDMRRLDDLLRARIVIEGAAMELAAPRLAGTGFEKLKALIRDHYSAISISERNPIESQIEINKAFHFVIYEASGSDVLIPIIESLWLQSGPYIRAAAMAFDVGAEIPAPHFHLEIVAALEARDVAAARLALAADIGRAFDLLRTCPAGDEGAQS
jgi:DNA-binding GntR family transcriptional regulator